MTQSSKEMIDSYISFVEKNIEAFSHIGNLAAGSEVPPEKVAWALSHYYDVCLALNCEYQRVKVERVSLEIEYEEIYAEWFREAREKLILENVGKSSKPSLEETKQQIKVLHKEDYFGWQRKLSEAEMKCDFYLRQREILNKYDSILVNLAQMIRSELRSLNIENRANAREKYMPIR